MNFFRSLFSKAHRQTGQLYDHVLKVFQHQRDVMPEPRVAEMTAALAEMKRVLRESGDSRVVLEAAGKFEETAQRCLMAYPNPGLRENLDMILVAGALAIGFRTFFFQPMEIPTGSAQPTFYGITHEDYRNRPEVKMPGAVEKFFRSWLFGETYVEVIAKQDGMIDEGSLTRSARISLGGVKLFKTLEFTAGGVRYKASAPAENPELHLGVIELDGNNRRLPPRRFRAGEPILRCKVVSGDKLFVNRMVYNFRRPQRGETIVFRSENHPDMTPRTHYIKRLVALGPERVTIGDDRHVTINGRRLDAKDPGFEKVYSFDPAKPAADSQYSGHLNGEGWRRIGREPYHSRNFMTAKDAVDVRPGHYLTFGDNTVNSADSRYWSEPDFPRERVIGKSGFVFWPFTSRWGWHQH